MPIHAEILDDKDGLLQDEEELGEESADEAEATVVDDRESSSDVGAVVVAIVAADASFVVCFS